MKAKALIIGNADYNENKLENTVNDANDIDEVLKRLGYETTKKLNLNTIEQDNAITNFASNLDDYDIGLFYFAGHGFEHENINYLAAIDTNFQDKTHAKHSAFSLNVLLDYLNTARNETNIIIMDACRSKLKDTAMFRSISNSGLAPIFAPKGTLIAFATSPGQNALEGTGQRNGVYTKALLQHILAKNIPIEEMFKRVRNTVFDLSGGKQTSWEHTSLTGTYFFNYGQLSYSSEIEYSSKVVIDSSYVYKDTSLIDSIIKDLKSMNWYTQNTAMKKISSIEVSITDKNELFLLGRNILQVACGKEYLAIEFMQNLYEKILPLHTGNYNHVLNGIIFEMFFNSYGSFRYGKFKDDYLNEIYEILEKEIFNNSLEFLTKILIPFQKNIFYLPSINSTGISLDLNFEPNDSLNELKLKGIKHEGKEILVEKEINEFSGIDVVLPFKSIEFNELQVMIAKEMLIPKNKLVLTSNIDTPEDYLIKYPRKCKIIK